MQRAFKPEAAGGIRHDGCHGPFRTDGTCRWRIGRPSALVGSLAGSTILLYLAVTYTVQRLVMQARAQRLPASNDRAGALTSHRL